MAETHSLLTCPHCGHSVELEMPIYYCQINYKCQNCKKTITPKDGDCCIFCSYGDKKCPSMQDHAIYISLY
jgi:hypothetical protein